MRLILSYSSAIPPLARSWGPKVNPHTTGKPPNSLQILLDKGNTLHVFERLVPQMKENRRSVLSAVRSMTFEGLGETHTCHNHGHTLT